MCSVLTQTVGLLVRIHTRSSEGVYGEREADIFSEIRARWCQCRPTETMKQRQGYKRCRDGQAQAIG